jgi:hypothetical protein
MSAGLQNDDAELVDGWLRHAAGSAADVWAWERMNDLIRTDRTQAWRVIVALVEKAPDEILGNIGVGPLEHFVKAHDSAVVDKVASLANANARFREALSWIWLRRGELPPHVERRLQEVTGDGIRVD